MTLSELIIWVVAVVAAVVGGVITKVLADDAKSFVPRLAQNLLRRASLRLGEEYAASFYEEWSAHLIEIPETSGKLLHAVTIYFWGAYKIRAVLCPATSPRVMQRFSKRVFDLVLVVLACPVAGLMVLLLAALVMLDGKQPFYSEIRVGRHGRFFRIWKLRTMVHGADLLFKSHLEQNASSRREWQQNRKPRTDPHITIIGRIIRETGLDELPQMWNVMNGTMSLVGPRPLLTEQRDLYNRREYYHLRPGITGLWAISARFDCTFKDRERLDDTYFKQQSLLTDINIMLATIMVTLQPPK